MNCTKQIVITGFQIKYMDLREPKPRTPKEEIYTVENDWLDAMITLHLDVHDAIRARYERLGYKVFNIGRISPKCVVTLDLNDLWEKNAQDQQIEEYLKQEENMGPAVVPIVQGATASDTE